MELFDNLDEVKEALFDAPADVKESFNNLVKYFDSNKSDYNPTIYIIGYKSDLNNPKYIKHGSATQIFKCKYKDSVTMVKEIEDNYKTDGHYISSSKKSVGNLQFKINYGKNLEKFRGPKSKING